MFCLVILGAFDHDPRVWQRIQDYAPLRGFDMGILEEIVQEDLVNFQRLSKKVKFDSYIIELQSLAFVYGAVAAVRDVYTNEKRVRSYSTRPMSPTMSRSLSRAESSLTRIPVQHLNKR